MKVYITARFHDADKEDIEDLSAAVVAAGMKDFCFIRDVEHYQKTFDNLADLWERALEEISNCDALLINVSDHPSGGRTAEVGIAYALGKPIFAISKTGTEAKGLFRGMSSLYVDFDDYAQVTAALKKYLQEQ